MSASIPPCLIVVRFADGWRIMAQDRRWGRFDYRVDAEEAAIRLARRARAEGRDVSIFVQDCYGRLEGLTAA